MALIGNILITLIAILHFYILIIEMFFWDKPKGRKAFGLEKDFAASTKVMAANQGLYNGFLAAGLLLSIIVSLDFLKVFFLSCICIAGIFGGITSNRKILLIQGVPSLLAITAVLLSPSF